MPNVFTVRPNGPRIRELRGSKSRSQIARRTGRHYMTIAKIESGKLTRVSEAMLIQIAHELGVRPEDITLPDDAEPDRDAA